MTWLFVIKITFFLKHFDSVATPSRIVFQVVAARYHCMDCSLVNDNNSIIISCSHISNISLLENVTALCEQRQVLHRQFVLCQFIECQPNRLSECQQYNTGYVDLAFARPMLYIPFFSGPEYIYD